MPHLWLRARQPWRAADAVPDDVIPRRGHAGERAADNHLVCLKLSKMARTIHDDDSESDDDSDEDDEDPIVIIEYHHISFDIISVCLYTCIMMYHNVSCDIMFHDIT